MSPVTISQVSTRPYTFELNSSLRWGKGHQLESLEHVLVTVELSDGAVGMAEAPPRPTIYGETPESITAIIQRELAPMLAGQTLQTEDDIHTLYQQLSLVKNNNTAKGALDLALHMALAKSRGQSIAQMLGVTRPSVPVSFILGTGTTQAVMDEVRWAFEQGVRVLKVKVGRDFEREAEQITQIRQEYGDALQLYADANQCYTAENAVQHLRAFAGMGVLWCEEPLPVTQMRNRQALHPLSPLPLIGDDSAFTLPDLRREVNFNTFDILNIKTARTGYSESSALLRHAVRHSKGVMVGSQAGSLLGCLHALLFAGQEGIDYPTEGTFFLKVKDNYEGLVQIVDGAINLQQAEQALAQIEADLLRHPAA